ncbi:MAG TPA: SigE family RNA polymerase sigma factor [Micromonosporaceae bacterium]|nr:SigE family RNA polymerase sigma factor [Micromonosporaceae bacterium]
MTAWLAPDSFDDFVSRRHGALLRFAHVLSGDPHTAADLVQDALVRAGIAWHRILRQEDPEAYLRRTIVNLNLNRWRRLRREQLTDAVPDTGRLDAPSHDDAVWAALAKLPRAQRTVLVLRFYEDMSQAQIADVLGCAIGTVKSHTSRAMDNLRTLLEDETPARRTTGPEGVVA